MKNVLTLAALLFLTAGAAQAADAVRSLEASRDGFVKEYTLDSFKIAPQSQALSGIVPTHGGVYLDEANRTLRIVLSRDTVCEPGKDCRKNRLAWLALPVVLDLPVVYIGSPFCGGRVITAENDMRREDGALVRVQVLDDNGSRCEPSVDGNTIAKRVTVTVEEQAARSNETIVSTLSGFPVQRLSMDISVRR